MEKYTASHEEHARALKCAGFHHGEAGILDIIHARVSKLVWVRLPWLLVGLIGGVLAINIVKYFETVLQKQIALAFFIPVIVYMADAVGTQTEALFIRSEIIGGIRPRRYILREAIVGFFLGLIIASLNFLFAYILFRDFKLALIVGISLFITIFLSVYLAVLIPICLIKLKKDPSVGSGPFATVLQDILSITVYFVIATLML